LHKVIVSPNYIYFQQLERQGYFQFGKDPVVCQGALVQQSQQDVFKPIEQIVMLEVKVFDVLEK